MPGALMVVWCVAVQIFAIGLYCLQPHAGSLSTARGFELFQHLALALPAVGLGPKTSSVLIARPNRLNVSGDDRAALLFPDLVRLAVQVKEPT
jgi:hypothetical protein